MAMQFVKYPHITTIALIVSAFCPAGYSDTGLGPILKPTFNDTRYPQSDRAGLRAAWDLLERNYQKYAHPEVGPDKVSGNCVDAASYASNDICDACSNAEKANTNSALHGWKVISITTVEPCHDATLLVSPSGNQYYVDPYWNDHRIVQMRVNSDGYLEPIDAHKDLMLDYMLCGRLTPPDPIFGKQWAYPIIYIDPKFKINDGSALPPYPRNPPYPNPFQGDIDCVNRTCVRHAPARNAVLPLTESRSLMCPTPDPGRDASLPVLPVSSLDPNDKVGSRGAAAAKYVSTGEPLRYEIVFENVKAATAPAQKVTIIDQLDTTNMDLATLKLGPISFGKEIVVPPVGRDYATTVDLRPGTNVLVKIEAKLDALTGVLSWVFTSLDPATGNAVTDPLAGFLPPNKNPPEGEGSVVVTVMPKRGMATGAQIRNRASIVFDTNAPILTPEWLNTIDSSTPTSRVLPLSSQQVTAAFPVQWQGSDNGAGILDYTVYVSDNGGPFTPWLGQSTATQSTFAGVFGHTYSFYSIARDLVGNVEGGKGASEATTRVVADTTPPAIVPIISGTLGNNGWYRSNVTVNWSINDPESGIASSSNGCSPTTLATDTPGMTLTCSAINGAGLPRSVSVTIKIDKTTPVISGMPPAGCTLWPPNHGLVQVATVGGSDALSGLAAFGVTGASNEPENGTGDGDTAPDIVITGSGVGPRAVRLRAERAGTGTGRIYTLTATASDQAGNSVSARATCSVPLSQGQ